MFRKTFFLSLFLAATLLIVALPSFAKSKGQGKSSQIKTFARLTACCGNPAPGVKGHVDHKIKIKKGRLDRVDLKAIVEATPNSDLPPGPRDIRLILSDGGVEYAECLLVSEGEDDDDEDEVEFKLDLRAKKGSLYEKRGSCDADLLTPGVQHDIPAIEAGDVAIITFVQDPLDRTRDIDFLMGIFE
jgi:hypothetical protein